MNKVTVVFQLFGFWDSQTSSSYSKTVKVLQFLLFVSFPILMGLGAVFSDNKKESIFLAAAALAVFVQVVRLFVIMWKRTEIIGLIDQVLLTDDERYTDVTMDKFMKFASFLVCMITVTMVVALVFFAASGEKDLPANIAFPLDYRNSRFGYWVAYLYIVIASVYSMVIFLLNIIIWYLMLSFSINYYLLGNQLKRTGNFYHASDEATTKVMDIPSVEKDNIFQHDLITSIKSGQQIRETIARFTSCFSILILFQITTSGMGIGGSVYTLAFSNHESLSQSLIYIALLLYNFFDIFMLMFFGNKIKLAGERMSYCLFECNWIERRSSCTKCIIIVFEVLKGDHELVIGKLYRLKLETFSSILNLAYSMFNILQSLS